jgi:ribosomal protein L29
MAKQTTQKKDIKGKTAAELRTLVTEARETLRVERFKDKFSRQAGVVREQKLQIARALTELSARQTADQNSND